MSIDPERESTPEASESLDADTEQEGDFEGDLGDAGTTKGAAFSTRTID